MTAGSLSRIPAGDQGEDDQGEDYVELTIGGMSCAACAGRLERVLNKLDGVQASVNFATERAMVTGLSPAQASTAIHVVERAGYSAALRTTNDDAWTARATSVRLSSLRRRLTVSALLTVPLCDLTIMLALVPGWRFPGWQAACVLLAVPVVSWAAWPFHRATVHNLRNRVLTMDTLVTLGALVSFGWALYTMIFDRSTTAGYWLGFGTTPAGADSIYLDVAAGMVTFQLGGRYFETRARRGAGDVLHAIANLAVQHVRLLRPDGSEDVATITDLRVGDSFVVLPGERLPADGTVTAGDSTIDTSAMTGESTPAEVACGDTVVGGTINVSGRIVVRADRVGAHTRLAQMAALADEAQRRKARVQKFADKVSSIFVPVVVALAGVVTLAWLLAGATANQAVSNGIAVLIIACPCALGLATPTALMVGVGRGSQLGILIKSHDALEASGVIDTVVLDKTGTLTTGTMRLAGVLPLAGHGRAQVLAMAGALESASEHAIATAVVAAARAERIPLAGVENFIALPGLGARALVEGREVLLGNSRLLAEQGVEITAEVQTRADGLEDDGLTVVLLAVDAVVWAILTLSDTVKPSARPAVQRLHRLGLHTILLTGDSQAAADAVGAAIGVDEVIARVLPTDKARTIEDLQRAGRRVAMVGDGINDAAALATANLGMAMVKGSDIAMKSADIILVRDDLRAIVDAVLLSRRTLRTIRGNLAWAFGYNIAAIPIAAAGLLNPLIAAAAMALSSTLVVSNSLRLRTFEPMSDADA